LIDQAARAGRAEQVEQLRRRKAALDRAADDYRRLLSPAVPRGGFDELGRLAETLGRWFEARGWWTLAVADPARVAEARAALTRLDRIGRARRGSAGKGCTVAETLADLIPGRPPQSEASARPAAVPTFRDDARLAGLDFVYDHDPTPMCRLPETMAGG